MLVSSLAAQVAEEHAAFYVAFEDTSAAHRLYNDSVFKAYGVASLVTNDAGMHGRLLRLALILGLAMVCRRIALSLTYQTSCVWEELVQYVGPTLTVAAKVAEGSVEDD